MRHRLDLSTLRIMLIKGLNGPQMLAFLPAVCLTAFWVGGEHLLVLCALAIPLIYAAFGGIGLWADRMPPGDPRPQDVQAVAREFLQIAQHNGQTTACLQIALPALERIIERFGADHAAEARTVIQSRIRSTLRAHDHVFEDGATRFTVLISPGYRLRLDNLLDLGKRIRAAVEAPFLLEGTTHCPSAAIGIASSLNFGRNVTAESWMHSATEALNEALLTGEGSTRLWSDRLSRLHKSRHDLRSEITSALDQGRVQAVFQPQVNLRTGAVCGMETFARWDHPTRGMLTASEFLATARDRHQMSRLGRTIFLQATTALRGWDAAGFDVKTISLNMSEDELRDPELAARIKGDLARCDLAAHRVILEIPSALLAKPTDVVFQRNLGTLADLGCGLDLDGFGIDAASPVAIQQSPVTRLKLDRALIKGIDQSNDQKRALHAVLGICERLDLAAVATGVETLEESGVLRELGCGYAQGHLFASPAPAAEIQSWLSKEQTEKPQPAGTRIRRVK